MAVLKNHCSRRREAVDGVEMLKAMQVRFQANRQVVVGFCSKQDKPKIHGVYPDLEVGTNGIDQPSSGS